MTKQTQLVTIYVTGEFMGTVQKREGKLVDFGTQKYAQFDNAPFVKYIPTRKRNVSGLIKTSFPYLVILKGTGHPEPDSMCGPVEDQGMVKVSKSRYSAFDDRWRTDFDTRINAYLQARPELVLMDVRCSANTNIVNK